MNLILMGMVLYGSLLEHVHLVILALMILVMLLIIGFIFSSYILERKHKVDENVLHLSKEILHELTIPLSTIQANSLLLGRTVAKDEKSMKRLKRIEDASKRLERLYDELVYGIKKEIHIVDSEELDLLKLIEERVDIMRLFNRNEFILELEPTKVLVDSIGFEKMLDNILNNAMKYSDKTSVIEIELKEDTLTIKDHGIGIDEVILKRIFRRYYQSKETNLGEGIGLALVKAYCEDENIGIKINSEKLRGTTVCLNLKKCII